ncbi:hypothetical protein [Aureibacter tunicatorum]|uniref:Uncharacterized protein n=1 Tax=Aureibacter tunicatorum TaxID=866807 RepID=A0AAE4BRB7_9BACT|nr:hypothetical protein [Aureibacter tunicatorum]MDR6238496.1 hypothetical protein [Aureibacter tunicatorum]BDD05571.1 hypothetical protein AUTU_30540 [Aureibacter tunicatorum]
MNRIELNQNKWAILIVFWIVLGYVFSIDFSQNVGCISYITPDLEIYRASFALISFSLIGSTFFVHSKHYRIGIFAIEFILYLTILFILKGGYMVGFGGAPDEAVYLYDWIAVTLRFYNLSLFISNRQTPKVKWLLIALPIILSLALMQIKAKFLAMPIYFLNL